jgi:hypothetical protein
METVNVDSVLPILDETQKEIFINNSSFFLGVINDYIELLNMSRLWDKHFQYKNMELLEKRKEIRRIVRTNELCTSIYLDEILDYFM